ncbi:sulfite exporter TauE/SafE family protein [Abyssisolibacter fermentans]|uniref:sulfite exporter TauE/SafE family protein n=1 Tax=Abyssisolibacter fermentans TaxID=1766203 RepID=UPI00082C2F34|nr:sulfite exporter TauE/SafE family protein [Abyssisolibacter fermentans]
MITAIIIANFVIGISIGVSGIAGFLLPMFYVGVLTLPVADSMTLSFAAFAVSGIIGTLSYHRSGDIDFKFIMKLMIGSIIGSLIGVWANGMVDVRTAKIVLYIMVLCSSISLLFSRKDGDENSKLYKLRNNNIFVVLVGTLIAAISSFSGAGGPILSVPLLSLLGFNIRQAVGMSLFNSIFIAIPAFIGYYTKASLSQILLFMILCAISHGIGTLIGARISSKINQRILKLGIAFFSIIVSVYMLWTVI